MKRIPPIAFALIATLSASPALAADQTVPGAGNAEAVRLAKASPLIRSAYQTILRDIRQISDAKLASETRDAIENEATCVRHRAGLDDAMKNTIVAKLSAAGLFAAGDAASFPGGALAGVFPPVLADGSNCPQLPQPFISAPGGGFHGHHSYPGGLSIHEAGYEIDNVNFAAGYRRVYGHTGPLGLPEVAHPSHPQSDRSDVFIDQDVIVAASLLHDWAKTIVFQWNADGSEFKELPLGGNGSNDNYGAAGDSRTGAHHIIGVAESMKRGLSPELVVSQASAHNTPTSGNEYKIVNWLRAAAIIAQIDPVARGYLRVDSRGHLRMPAVRALGEIDLNEESPSQTNFLVEYVLNNLSDADFVCTGPALTVAETVLTKLAGEFGYNPADVTTYNTRFRNPALSYLSGARIMMLYSEGGLKAIRVELGKLRARGII